MLKPIISWLLTFRWGAGEATPPPDTLEEINAILTGPTTKRLTLRGPFHRVLKSTGTTTERVTLKG